MRLTGRVARLTAPTAVGVVFLVALGVAPVRAGDDDDVPIDTKIIRSILGELGLKRGDEPQIDYQERGPLVLPPNLDLPPPENPNAAIANNPAWPKDPDIARAKAQADMERNRDIEAERMREENPLPPDQLTPGARTNPGALRPSRKTATSTGERRMTPSELGYMGNLFSNMFGAVDDRDAARFTGEPERTSLTDPPPGYQTPSPDQPYASGKSKRAPTVTNSYATHGEVDSGSH